MHIYLSKIFSLQQPKVILNAVINVVINVVKLAKVLSGVGISATGILPAL